MKKLVTLFTLIAFASCGQMGNKTSQTDASPAAAPSIPTNWKTYLHDNYSIQYPPGWQLKENYQGSNFTLIAPGDSANSKILERISFVKQDVTGQNLTLDKIPDMVAKSSRIIGLKNFIPISRKNAKSNGNDFAQIVFGGQLNNVNTVFEEWCCLINNEAYILTFTTLKEQWNANQKDAEQILSTFQVK
jgi:hypothetical protein